MFHRFSTPRVRHRLRAGLAAIALLALAPAAALAVRPMTPNLERESREALVEALGKAGIPETGSSAVLVALERVLGVEPANRDYRYREPYPQLPVVDAVAVPAEAGCAKVDLTASPKAEPRRQVRLSGVYCLAEAATYTWRARSQAVEGR